MEHEDKKKNKEFKERNWVLGLCHSPIGYGHMEGMRIGDTELQEVVRDNYIHDKPLAGRNVWVHALLWIQKFLPQCGSDDKYRKLRVDIVETPEVLKRQDLLPFALG